MSNPQSSPLAISQTPPMDDPNNEDPQQSARTSIAALCGRLPCCGADPSNPCRPRGPHQSGYWLLISMVLLAFVMVIPLLKGLLSTVSAYINLLIFLFIFFFRKPEPMAVMGVASVVVAHTFFGVAMYIHYAQSYGSCEPLLMIGFRAASNLNFCHERSYEIISIVVGCVWLLIGGCLFRFVEVRRAELALQTFRQQNRLQQEQALQEVVAMTTTTQPETA